MPINIEYNGKVVQFPDGTSEDVISNALRGEAAIEQNQEVASTTENPEKTEQNLEDSYIQGKFKQGVGSGYAFLKTLAETGYDTLSKGYGGQTWTQFGEEWTKNMDTNQKEQVDFLTDVFGWDKPDLNLLPSSEVERIIGTGAELSTDPLVIASKAKTLTELIVKGVVRAGEWFGIGVTAESAGSGAAQLEEMVTGEDTGTARAVVTLASTLGSAKATGKFFRKTEDKANALFQNSKMLNTKKSLKDATEAFSVANTQSLLKNIAKSETKNVEDILKDFKQISHYFNDVDIPFFMAMSDNPVVKGELNKLLRKNPNLRGQVDAEINKIVDAIEEKSNFLFGAPVSGKAFAKELPTSEVRASLTNRLTNLKKSKTTYTNKIDELAYSLKPQVTSAERGIEIQKLVNNRLRDAKEIRTLEYAEILGKAKRDKVVMPQEAVQDIWAYVKSTRLDDMFGKGTDIERSILRFLKPITTVKNGKPVTEFPKLNFSGVNSLKKAINSKLRTPISDIERSKLEELKQVVDKARQKIPGNLNAALKVADRNYYENIGIPFGSQGIKEINTKKYANQVAPVIVKDAEQLQQFLDVAGTQGRDIAKNALLSEVYAKAVVNGEIKPAIVNKLIKDKRDVLNLLPGMREELENAAKHQGYLATRLDDINTIVRAQEKKIGDHFLVKSGGVEGYQPSKVVKKMTENREYLTKILDDIRRLPPKAQLPVQNTLRRQFIEHIGDHPEGAVAWLRNPENKYTIDKIMGADYSKHLNSFARLSDKVRKIDLEKVANVPTGAVYDWFQQKLNIDLASVVATIRRPIVSPFQKGLILASRIWTGGRGSAADKRLEELLLTNVDGLEKFYKLEQKYKGKMDAMSLLKDYTNIVGEITPKYIYAGVKNAAENLRSTEQLKEKQEEIRGGLYY